MVQTVDEALGTTGGSLIARSVGITVDIDEIYEALIKEVGKKH